MVQLRPRSSLRPGTNPYVGPRAFGKADQLYGRDRELRELTDLLISERVVVMHSPSGAGKTSLINAADGLLRELERQRFRPLGPVRVNQQPPNKLSAVAGRYAYSIMESLESARQSKRMVGSEQLARVTLAQYLKKTQQLAPKDERSSDPLVLILDQFEEVFTLNPTDAKGRLQFFSDLGDLLDDEPIWLLFAMREDLLGELEAVSHLVVGDLAIRYRLSLLERPAAREAIMQPAKRQHDVTVTGEAADLLLDNLCTIYVQSPGSPPLPHPSPYVEGVILQTVLLNLWQELDPVQKGRQVIKSGDLGDLQHVDRALGRHYHDSVKEAALRSRLPERIVRDWFEIQLITEQGWRNQADHGPGDGGRKAERCLTVLEEQHIIRSESRLNRQWWELVHDRFLNPVKDDNARWRRNHELDLIPTAAKTWAEEKRPELLLPAARIVTAAAWLEAHERDAYPIERQYIAESEKAAQAEIVPLDSHRELERTVEYLSYYEQEVSEMYLRLRRANRRLWVLAGLMGSLMALLVGLLAVLVG
jgi:Novel STAND NTPase 1